jgi:AAA+ superfamily predicted ATPase
VLNRPPLVILAGDVGSGKTELAETIGDAVARQENIELELLPLSLSARGQGKVGQMTQLLSGAFDFTIKEAMRLKDNGAVILLVDEADALAQSRESEMHHEDRSGVNTFIRGIDRLANQRLPAAVIMCTNRYQALDPAVRRRAAEILVFERPGEEGRRQLLSRRLSPIGFGPHDVEALVAATGPREGGEPGFTYSDMMQRLLPTIVLDAYPHSAIRPERAAELALGMRATAAFRDEA